MKTYYNNLKLLIYLIPLFVSTLIYSQDREIEISPNKTVASILLPTEEYNSWIQNNDFLTNRNVVSSITKDLYTKFEDQYDFIIFVLNETEQPETIFDLGINNLVNTNISGISGNNLLNPPTFDDSSIYGSDGRLRSLMHFTTVDNLLNGPFLHEIMHNWGNYAIESEEVYQEVQDGPFLFGMAPGHFGFTGGSTPGQLGGFDQNTLIINEDGSYTVNDFGPIANEGDSVPYNEYELYLMGMIPLEEVTPFDTFTDITDFKFTENNGINTFTFKADTNIRYTPERILNDFGPRIPSYKNSQKEFNILTVVVTNTKLTEEQWATFENNIQILTQKGDDGSELFNFWEATRGIGSLNPNLIEKTTTLNVNDIAFTTNDFKIHPVPADQILTLQNTNKQTTVNKIVLCNAIGKKIDKFLFDKTTTNINISKYTPGIYYLLFQKDAIILETKKIIIN